MMIKRIGGKIGKDGHIESFYERWDIRELEKEVGLYWLDTIVPVPIDLKELVLLLPTPVISPN